MATPPKRLNSGEREVTKYTVPNADDRDVEREQQNRINQKLKDLIEGVEAAAAGGGGGGSGGVTDHGDLTGLNNDDHALYLTAYRAFVWLQSVLNPQSGVDIEYDAAGSDVDLYILTTEGTAAEALAAGDFVSLDASGEVALADASTNDLVAHGFVLAAYTLGATDVRVYYGAENTELSGLTVGDQYYLSDATPGAVTDTPPGDASPIIVQQLGVAKSATSMLVNIQQPIERPE